MGEWEGGGGVAPCVGQISNLILADGKSPKVPLPRSHSGNVARVLRALGCRGNEMPSGAKLNLPHSSFYTTAPPPPPLHRLTFPCLPPHPADPMQGMRAHVWTFLSLFSSQSPVFRLVPPSEL